jgi:hypothetical protein
MSGIDKPLKVPLLIKKGRSAMFTVQPLTEPVKRDFLAEAQNLSGDVDALRALWLDAQAAGEPQEHLATIAAMAKPANEPAA